MNKTVDDCPVCEPVNDLIDFLENNNYKVVEEKVSDYHFHEVYFRLEGPEIEIPQFPKISKHTNTQFVCECHWSMVELNIKNADRSS